MKKINKLLLAIFFIIFILGFTNCQASVTVKENTSKEVEEKQSAVDTNLYCIERNVNDYGTAEIRTESIQKTGAWAYAQKTLIAASDLEFNYNIKQNVYYKLLGQAMNYYTSAGNTQMYGYISEATAANRTKRVNDFVSLANEYASFIANRSRLSITENKNIKSFVNGDIFLYGPVKLTYSSKSAQYGSYKDQFGGFVFAAFDASNKNITDDVFFYVQDNGAYKKVDATKVTVGEFNGYYKVSSENYQNIDLYIGTTNKTYSKVYMKLRSTVEEYKTSNVQHEYAYQPGYSVSFYCSNYGTSSHSTPCSKIVNKTTEKGSVSQQCGTSKTYPTMSSQSKENTSSVTVIHKYDDEVVIEAEFGATIEVTKIWKDYDDVYKLRPDALHFNVYRSTNNTNWEILKEGNDYNVTIDSKNEQSWKVLIVGLIKLDNNGVTYKFKVEELECPYFYPVHIDGNLPIYTSSEPTYGRITIENKLKSVDISGNVWLDGQTGIKPAIPSNGKMDVSEKRLENIVVNLWYGTPGTGGKTLSKVASTETNSRGQYFFQSYEIGEYFVEFEYDGINYITTAKGDSSNSFENLEKRREFNNKFKTIMYGESNGGIKLKYKYENNKSVLKTNIDNSTRIDSDFIMKATTALRLYKDNSENDNLGLIKRGMDISLSTDVNNAVVSINGQTTNYLYNKEDNSIVIGDEQSNQKNAYNLFLYISDYNYRIRDYSSNSIFKENTFANINKVTGLKTGDELDVKVIYKLNLQNNTQTSNNLLYCDDCARVKENTTVWNGKTWYHDKTVTDKAFISEKIQRDKIYYGDTLVEGNISDFTKQIKLAGSEKIDWKEIIKETEDKTNPIYGTEIYYTCPICGSEGAQGETCKYCNTGAKQIRWSEGYKTITDYNKPIYKTETYYVCSICGAEGINGEECETMYFQDTPWETVTRTETDYNSPIYSSQKYYTCPNCGEEGPASQTCSKCRNVKETINWITEYRPNGIDVVSWKCNLCSYRDYARVWAYAGQSGHSHYTTYNYNTEKTRDVVVGYNTKKVIEYKCGICGQQFISKNNHKHEKSRCMSIQAISWQTVTRTETDYNSPIYSSKTYYTCPRCGLEGPKGQTCTKCGTVDVTSWEYYDYGPGNAGWECLSCGKTVSTRQYVYPEQSGHKCTITYYYNIENSRSEHTGYNTKTITEYKCNICNQQFESKEGHEHKTNSIVNKEQTRQIQTGYDTKVIKTYQCDICGVTVEIKDGHTHIITDEDVKVNVKQERLVINGYNKKIEKSYQCSICNSVLKAKVGHVHPDKDEVYTNWTVKNIYYKEFNTCGKTFIDTYGNNQICGQSKNQSIGEVKVNEIKYKYDSKYSFEGFVNESFNIQDLDNILTIDLNQLALSEGETKTLYLIFKVKKTTDLINLGEFYNSAEITSYSTNEALIDVDSQPGNFINGNQIEDDNDNAAGLKILCTQERELTGKAFDKDGNNINGIIVQLIELKKVQGTNYEYIWQEAVSGNGKTTAINMKGTDLEEYTYEKADGYYKFKGYIPGDYIVRFIYGDGTTYDMTNSVVKYNGQDYKTMTNINYKSEWYNESSYNQGVSVANDNEARRLETMAYSINIDSTKGVLLKLLDNKTPNTLNLTEKNLILAEYNRLYNTNITKVTTDVINQLLKEQVLKNTWMCAETSKIKIPVDTETTEAEENTKPYINVNGTQTNYKNKINNINLGLELRPETKIELKKYITGFKLIASNGQTLVNAYIDVNEYLNGERDISTKVQGIKDYITILQTVWQYEVTPVEINTLIDGAKLEFEYTLVVKNTGEDDYLSKDLANKYYNSTTDDYVNYLIYRANAIKSTLKDGTYRNQLGITLGSRYYTGVTDDETGKVLTEVTNIRDYVNNYLLFIKKDGKVEEDIYAPKKYRTLKSDWTMQEEEIKTILKTTEPTGKLDNTNNAIMYRITLGKDPISSTGNLMFENYIAEVMSFTNAAGRRSMVSSPGNAEIIDQEYRSGKTHEIDEADTARIQIGVATGDDKQASNILIAIAIFGIISVVTGVYVIKRYIL